MKCPYALVALLVFWLVPLTSFAEENTQADQPTGIPFKAEQSLIQDAGWSISVVIVFLIIAGVLLLVIKKNGLNMVAKGAGGDDIEVVSVKRVTLKTTAYILKVRDHEMLVVQHGDAIQISKLDKK